MNIRSLLFLSALAALAALTTAAPASAAVTVGSNLTRVPDLGLLCAPDCTLASTVIPATDQAPGGVASSIDGVIVRWRIRSGAGPAPVNLRVLSPGAGDIRTGAGTGPPELPAANAVSTFNAQIPIHIGDNIGIDITNAGPNYFNSEAGSGTRLAWQPKLADASALAAINQTNRQVLVNADIELDCDHDGLGDETQDANTASCNPPPAKTTSPTGGCPGRAPTIIGTPGPDRLAGTDGPDVIKGLGGDDVINSVGGDDLICGGDGDDTLRGGSGHDRLLGGGGGDLIKGGKGRDAIFGGFPDGIEAGASGSDRCPGAGDDRHKGCRI